MPEKRISATKHAWKNPKLTEKNGKVRSQIIFAQRVVSGFSPEKQLSYK